MKIKNSVTFILIICSLICLLTTNISAKTYSDVPTTHWAYTAINYMSNKGFIDGNNSGLFEPNKNMTRAEACVFIGKTIGVNTTNNYVNTGFTDVPSGNQYHIYTKLCIIITKLYRIEQRGEEKI